MTDFDDDDDNEILNIVRRRNLPPLPVHSPTVADTTPISDVPFAAVTFDPLLKETWARVATDRGN